MYAALDFPFAISSLGPHGGARVFILMNLGELAEEFARALIARIRRRERDLDNLVPTLIGPRIEHTLFPQPELLPVRRPLRNLQQRAAVNRRHLDAGTERRLPDSHWN